MKKVILFSLLLITTIFYTKAQILFSENFEDGVLDPKISIATVGSFNSSPGIKDRTEFGSTKAFGFGKSTCTSSCSASYATNFIITFNDSVYVDTLIASFMELDGDWGTRGEVYIDGVVIDTSYLANSPSNDNTGDIIPRVQKYYLNEYVKEIKFYVWDITNSSELFIDDISIYGKEFDPGLIAYYPFTGNANDSTYNNNDGVVNGGALLTNDRFGNPNSAYSFDGVDDFIDLSANNDLKTNNFTWSTWVKLSEPLSTSNVIFAYSGETTNDCYRGYLLQVLNTGEVFFSSRNDGCSSSTTIYSSIVLPTEDWHYIGATRDNSTGDMKLYIDGNLVGSATTTYGYDDIYVSIGARKNTYGTGDWITYFDGEIDDTRVYSRILDSTEIYSLYANYHAPDTLIADISNGKIDLKWSSERISGLNKYRIFRDNILYDSVMVSTANDTVYADTNVVNYQTYSYFITSVDTLGNESIHSDTILTYAKDTNLVAYYPFNSNANDESGNGYNGDTTGHAPTLAFDRFGNDSSSYYFNGIDNYIELPDLNLIQPVTISTWINIPDTSVSCPIYVSDKNESYMAQYYGINMVTGSGKISLSIGDGTYPNRSIQTDTILKENVWYHIVGKYEAGGQMNLFLNGIPVQYTENGNTAMAISSNVGENDDIGRDDYTGTGGRHYFKGKLDDIRVYTSTLTNSEIYQLYANYHPPTNVKGNSANNQIELSWHVDSVLQYQQFNIYRDGAIYDTVEVNTIADTTFTDSNVTIGTSYEYFITSTDTLGYKSIHSDTISVFDKDSAIVALYLFNKNANDESGYNNHGIINEAIPVDDRFGNDSSAYYFDGMNDFIEIADTNILHTGNKGSISLWINAEAQSKGNCILRKDSTGIHNGDFILKWDDTDSTTLSATFDNGVTEQSILYPNFPLNEWKHIVLSFNDSVAKLYVDNYIIDSVNTLNNYDFLGNSYDIYLSDTTNGFNGIMDDLQIYNYALTRSAISNIYKNYNAPSNLIANSVSNNIELNWHVEDPLRYTQFNIFRDNTLINNVTVSSIADTTYTDSDVILYNTYSYYVTSVDALGNESIHSDTISVFAKDSAIVALYPFNKNANDESGYNNHGIINEAIPVDDRFGNDSSSYYFDGMNDFIVIADTNILHTGNKGSISLWINAEAQSKGSCILRKDSTGIHNGDFILKWDDTDSTTLSATFDNGVTEQSILYPNFPLNEWKHIVLSFNDFVAKLYVDNQIIDSINTLNNYDFLGNSYDIYLSDTTNGFNGIIDDLRLYNYALTASKIFEIYANYQSPDTLIAKEEDGKIKLHWNYDTLIKPIKYNIYRDVITPVTTLYDNIDVTTDNDTSYIDIDVVNGVKYYYAISSIDSLGNESELSSEVKTSPIGLVAYYPFSTNANSSIDTTNNGTVNGAFLKPDRYNTDSSYYFDGIDDYIEIADTSNLYAGDHAAISLWINAETQGIGETILNKTIAGDNNGNFHLAWDNVVATTLKATFNDGLGDKILQYHNFPLNTWKHVVITFSDSTAKLYIDNHMVDSIHTLIDYNFLGNTANLYISDLSADFNGLIDDIRIYNRTLLEAEIYELYANYNAPILSYAQAANEKVTLSWNYDTIVEPVKYYIFRGYSFPSIIPYDSVMITAPTDTFFIDNNVLNDSTYFYSISSVDTLGNESQRSNEIGAVPFGLLAAYPFNGNANDESGYGNNGIVNGAILTTDRYGKVDSAFSFNGTDQYISIPYKKGFSSDTITFACWVYNEDENLSDPKGIIYKATDTTIAEREFGLALNRSSEGDALWLQTSDASQLQGCADSSRIYLNKWQHIVATIADNKYMQLYINGKKVKEQTISFSHLKSLADIVIGKASSSSLPANFWQGKIDDIYIYNSVLTQFEVNKLYGNYQAPENLTANAENNKIRISWDYDDIIKPVKYYIYRGSSPSITSIYDTVWVSNSSDTVYIDTNIIGGKTYYYAISSVDSLNNVSLKSEEVNAEAIGLVVYYPFNGNANDESGNFNNGFTTGHAPVLIKDRFGNNNSSFSFDGENSYISISQTIQGSSTKRSISVWLTYNDLSLNNVLFSESHDNGNGHSGSWLLRGEGPDKIDFQVRQKSDNQWISAVATGLEQSEWYHVVGVYSGDSLKLYINGKKVDAVECDSLSVSEDWGESEIGRDASDGNQWWNGNIDDVKIFNYALNEKEINQLYANFYPPTNLNGSCVFNTIELYWHSDDILRNKQFNIYRNGQLIDSVKVSVGEDTVYLDHNIKEFDQYEYYITSVDTLDYESIHSDTINIKAEDNNLIAYYPLDTNAYDLSGNDNDGIINGAVPATNRFGQANSAHSFDGVDDYIYKQTNLVENWDSGAVSLWVKFDTLGTKTHQLLYQSCPDNSNGSFQIRVDNSVLNTYLFGNHWTSGYLFDDTTIWYHVFFEWEKSGSTYLRKIYINGTLINSTSLAFTPVYSDANLYFYIGAARNSDNYCSYDYPEQTFGGNIDDIRIYSRSLSDLEIYKLYANYQPPQNLTLVSEYKRVTLNWNYDVNIKPVKYYIYKNENTPVISKYDTVIVSNQTEAFYIDTNINFNTTYYYAISSVDSLGNESQLSEEVMTTPYGMVAYYPFNGNANDESIHDNHGDITGHEPELSTDRFNNDNKAYSFDGSSDYIVIPQLIEGNTTSRTISLWFTYNDLSVDNILFAESHNNGNGHSGAWRLRGTGPDEIDFQCQRGSDDQWRSAMKDGLVASKWYHAVGVYTGDSIILYINSKKVSTLSIDSLSTDNDWGDTEIGRDAFDGNQWWNGNIDDIYVYNYALNGTEVEQLYANYYPPTNIEGLAENNSIKLNWHVDDVLRYRQFNIYRDGSFMDSIIVNSTNDTLYTDFSTEEFTTYKYYITSVDTLGYESIPSDTITVFAENKEVVAYYPFNNNANDESGNGNNGTVNGATLVNDRFGNNYSAYYFDGLDNNIEIPDNANIHLGNHASISFWINARNQGSNVSVLSKSISGDYNGNLIFRWKGQDSTTLEVAMNNGLGEQVVQYPKCELNKWIHVVLSVSDSIVKLYVNSELADSLNTLTNYDFMGNASDLLIGGIDNNYDGIIDDVRIYNCAISRSEIFNLYANYYPPQSLMGNSINNEIELSWHVNDVLRYKQFNIYRNSELLDSVEVSVIGDTSYTDANVKTFNTYNYYITSVDTLGNSSINSDTIIIFAKDTSLLAYYPFNNNANDESGNGHEGSIHGASLGNDRFGNNLSSFDFAAGANYIEVQDSINFHSGNQGAISFWLYSETQNSNEVILSKDNNGNSNGDIKLKWGELDSAILTVAMDNGSGEQYLQYKHFESNKWENVVINYSDSKSKLFINNQEVDSLNTLNNYDFLGNSANLIIGDLTNSFNGSIDDIRIYNQPLSKVDIFKLYANYSAPQNLLAQADTQKITLSWSRDTIINPVKYYIYRSKETLASNLYDSIVVENYADTVFNDYNVIIDTSYYYRITSLDSLGNISQFSNEVSTSLKIKGGVLLIQVTDFNNKGIENVNYSINPTNKNGLTDIDGRSELFELSDTNIYICKLNKVAYFSYIEDSIHILRNDTTKLKVILPKLADYNGDTNIDINDIDSLVLRWRAKDVSYELGPAVGVAPSLTVQPDSVLDFEDLMIFGMMWDYYNLGNKNNMLSNNDNTLTLNNDWKITSNKIDNIQSNTVTYHYILEGSGNLISNQLTINYNTKSLKYLKHEVLIPDQYSDISFTKQDENTGYFELSSGILQDNIVNDKIDLLTVTFTKLNDKMEPINSFYEVHFDNHQKENGKVEYLTEQKLISVYPNPARDKFYISLHNLKTDALLTIRDIAGKILMNKLLVEDEELIDISSLPCGLLILQVNLNTEQHEIKLIKQ